MYIYHYSAKLSYEYLDGSHFQRTITYQYEDYRFVDNEYSINIIIEKDFHLDLSNIPAKDENEAFSKVCRCVDKICKVLTILLQFQNYDCRKNSPNLTYLPQNVIFLSREVNSKNFCNDTSRNIKCLADRYELRDGIVSLNITQEFDLSDFNTIYSLITNSNDLAFGEIIYRATLSKNLESRFFQLFTLIEAIETKYGDDETIGHKMLQENALERIDLDLKKKYSRIGNEYGNENSTN